jgi:hypothetical protein
MVISTARILLVVALCLIFNVITAFANTGDRLQPEEGAFGLTMLNPYFTSVSERLLSDTKYRQCQAVMITSFQSESAVYLKYDDKQPATPPVVVSVKLEQPLWYALQEYFQNLKGTSISDADVQRKALINIKSTVSKREAQIEPDVAKVLESTWEAALFRVRYDEKAGMGLDGESIHYANFTLGVGYRTGTAWSPDKGTINYELAEIAKAMREYPTLSETDRKGASKTILTKAKKLLARLKGSK